MPISMTADSIWQLQWSSKVRELTTIIYLEAALYVASVMLIIQDVAPNKIIQIIAKWYMSKHFIFIINSCSSKKIVN